MIYCRYCARRVETDRTGEEQGGVWCPHCHRVFDVPLFRIPGWIAGAVCFLMVRTYFGV